MNGWLKKRDDRKRPDCWSIILDLGAQPGRKSRRQKWVTFHGTQAQARKRLRELLGTADRGEFVEPNKKLTLGSWLDTWLIATTPGRAPHTVLSFENAIRIHLKPGLGEISLQALRANDIEAYYARKLAAGLSAGTLKIHTSVLRQSLNRAVRDGLVHRNVASLAVAPQLAGPRERRLNCWTAADACAVLEAARTDSPQVSALLAVALESGARKGELQGLRWSDVSFESGELRIDFQLVGLDDEGTPAFGPTKTRTIRTVSLSSETLERLRFHREAQELQQQQLGTLANRHELVFARPHGGPLSAGDVRFILDRVTKAAGVRRITVHGLRHTSATLLLALGVQPHVVQQRLGHRGIGTTLNVYGHVIPSMQQDAALRLGAMFYGSIV